MIRSSISVKDEFKIYLWKSYFHYTTKLRPFCLRPLFYRRDNICIHTPPVSALPRRRRHPQVGLRPSPCRYLPNVSGWECCGARNGPEKSHQKNPQVYCKLNLGENILRGNIFPRSFFAHNIQKYYIILVILLYLCKAIYYIQRRTC